MQGFRALHVGFGLSSRFQGVRFGALWFSREYKAPEIQGEGVEACFLSCLEDLRALGCVCVCAFYFVLSFGDSVSLRELLLPRRGLEFRVFFVIVG